MPRFEFALAEEAEDDELRALLGRISMPGNITLAFLREPSFFLAEQAGNGLQNLPIGRDGGGVERKGHGIPRNCLRAKLSRTLLKAKAGIAMCAVPREGAVELVDDVGTQQSKPRVH